MRNYKGILLALLTAFSVSNVYIFSKAALNQIHLAQFGTLWFGFGIVWNLIFIFSTNKQKKFSQLTSKMILILGFIALLEMFGTLFFFLSVKSITNPANVSFLANINPLLITIMGVIILKEKLNLTEMSGMAICLIGALIISYQPNGDSLMLNGVQYVFISGLIYSISTITAKKNIKKLDPSFLALSRIIMLFIFSVSALIYFGLNLQIPAKAFQNVLIGSVLGPFLTGTLGYFTLRYLDASKASMIGTSRSVFVLMGSFVIFGNMPRTIQIIGGVLTISGVLLISFGKLKKSG